MEITVPDGMLMNEALIEQLTTQMLDAFARKAHTHSQSDITGLETTLAGFLKESDLDNVLKIRPGNWGYTKESKTSSSIFSEVTYYHYKFNQIENHCIAFFSGNISLLVHNDGNLNGYDSLYLPSGGIYLYGGAVGHNSSNITGIDIEPGIGKGGDKILETNSDVTEIYVGFFFAIRLS